MIPIPKASTAIVNAYYREIKSSLEDRISYVKRNGAIVGKINYTPSPNDIAFLDFLLQPNRLKELITVAPEKIAAKILEFKTRHQQITNKSDNLNRLLYGIFINTEYKKLDKWKFINRIPINSCMYCNRNHIYSLSKKAKIKPEIDHFYPKSLYPFLGLSYYNLIPSCSTCNGEAAKHEKDPEREKLISPYLIKDDDFQFTFDLKSMDILSPLDGNSKVSVKFKKKIKGNNKVFKLSKLYKKHDDHVLELIVKSKLDYSDDYRQFLKKFKGLTFSDEEINRLLIGNYTRLNELHKRPLSKLYRDIGIELGLII